MGRASRYPKPKARYNDGSWEVYWYWNYNQYSINVGSQDRDDPDIEGMVRRVAVALAMSIPAFPPEFAAAPAAIRYLSERCGIKQGEPESPAYTSIEDIFIAYKSDLAKYTKKTWATNSQNVLEKKIHPFVPGGILKMTPALARKYLGSVLDRGGKPNTRNNHLSICSRFFTWCKDAGLVTDSPFHGIKRMKSPDVEEVVYCTKAERDRVLTVAKQTGRKDWIAVPIALYAGCRRAEVFQLQWQDINFEARRLVVRKSKTGKKRTTPIARELLAILQAAKKDRGPVVPRMPGQGWVNQADRLAELCRESLCRPLSPGYCGQPCEAVGKRRFAASEDDIAISSKADRERLAKLREKFKTLKRGDPKEKKMVIEIACLENVPQTAPDGQPWLPAERIGWNAWRHTFATLRAQAGVSLDKISSWMGNSYDVCKKHYTQFMPRGEHEEDIDK